MNRITAVVTFLVAVISCSPLFAAEIEIPDNVSPKTKGCISCHRRYTPGIVYDWLTSRHAKMTLSQALQQDELSRRVSVKEAPKGFEDVVVGCAECHMLNTDKHKDNFAHMGLKINVVVTPNDCATCHPEEQSQYEGSKKAHAIGNLRDNPVYHILSETITTLKSYDKGKLTPASKSSDFTQNETCFGCHGTKVEVKGMKTIQPVNYASEISVPNLTNWPNQGVGRENPDGSLGSCTSCHPRHSFSMKAARDPHTCAQCHLDPDVPAYEIYEEGKHGNLYNAFKDKINFDAVPFVPGRDSKTPLCATCHVSLVTKSDGTVVAKRTHDFGSRLWWRIFGLIYAHPQPKLGNTNIIKNKDGLPLPTAFTGEIADEYLISKKEMSKREYDMKTICAQCHSTNWVNNHFMKFENTIKETNEMTKTATLMMVDAWGKGLADKSNPFDEAIEQRWVQQWLFYSNAIRYSSAMTGAPDYAAFKLGWWHYLRTLSDMNDTLKRAK